MLDGWGAVIQREKPPLESLLFCLLTKVMVQRYPSICHFLREGDAYRSILAVEKVRRLHRRAKVSLLEGLRRTVAYFAGAEIECPMGENTSQ